MIEENRIRAVLEKNYVRKLLKKGKRVDGRGLLEYRDFQINPNFVPKAEGSADVYLGKTRVMAGVKYDIGTPYSDRPEDSVAIVLSELVPAAHPYFETGPPNDQSIQLARVIDRGIRHSDCIESKKLCVIPGKAVYVLFIDLYTMDYAGNLTDCANIAAMVALISALLPKGKPDADNEKAILDRDEPMMRIPIKEIPISITFGKVDEYVFLDPNMKEEVVMDGALSFAIDERDQVVSIQKYGPAIWSLDELDKYGKIAVKKANELRDNLNLRQYERDPKDIPKPWRHF